MVCFSVTLLLPKSQRNLNDAAILRRFEHLLRHCNADFEKVQETESLRKYTIRLCDYDAVSLLRDLPGPFNVEKISILHSNAILYVYRKHHAPPGIQLLKNVYWLAKSSERWKLS